MDGVGIGIASEVHRAPVSAGIANSEKAGGIAGIPKVGEEVILAANDQGIGAEHRVIAERELDEADDIVGIADEGNIVQAKVRIS